MWTNLFLSIYISYVQEASHAEPLYGYELQYRNYGRPAKDKGCWEFDLEETTLFVPSEAAKPELRWNLFCRLRFHQNETRRVACDHSHSAVEGWSHAKEEETPCQETSHQTLVVGETRTQFHLIMKENLSPRYLRGFLPSYVPSAHQPNMLYVCEIVQVNCQFKCECNFCIQVSV